MARRQVPVGAIHLYLRGVLEQKQEWTTPLQVLFLRFLDHHSEFCFQQRRCDGDRHRFRIIVPTEDAGQLAALKPIVRDVMAGIGRELATRLA